LGLALPVWARTDSADLTVIQPTTIGTTQLKPGDYKVEVADNATQLRVVDQQNGKTVAEVPCQWIQLQKKPTQSEVVTNNNQVIEVDFGGKTQAVKVQ
jgi:hypothetical protein